jgi:antitoxin component of MazEF toxin-antitoxin module
VKDIADILGVSYFTVEYHLNPKWKTYLARYMRERLHRDPEFKKRFKKIDLRRKRKICERNKTIKVPKGSLVECPYCGYEWNLKYDHIPTHCPKCLNYLEKLPKLKKSATEVSINKRVRQVIKMGKGLGVTLPKRLCEKIDLKVGDAVFITFVDKNHIVIEPIRWRAHMMSSSRKFRRLWRRKNATD